MKAKKFPGVNVTLAENQPPYDPLPMQWVGGSNGVGITCWQLSDEELDHILRTREIWCTHLTFGQPFQPLAISADRPVWDAVEETPALGECGHGVKLTEHCPACQHPEHEEAEAVAAALSRVGYRCVHQRFGICVDCAGEINSVPKSDTDVPDACPECRLVNAHAHWCTYVKPPAVDSGFDV